VARIALCILMIGMIWLHGTVFVAAAQEINFSGMTRIGDNDFLVVHDKKYPRDAGSRVGIVTVNGKEKTGLEKTRKGQRMGPFSYHPLSIVGWPADENPANDLEAVCEIPYGNNIYLLAESGYNKGKFGRVFLIQVVKKPGKGWCSTFQGFFCPFASELPDDKKIMRKYKTPSELQIEGIWCLGTPDDKFMVIFARRGNSSTPAVLVWGDLKFDRSGKPHFEKKGRRDLTKGSAPLGGRGSAALMLRENKKGRGDDWDVWSVATVDPDDNGPFCSVIYQAGTFKWDEKKGFTPCDPVILWTLEGLKVEALSVSAEVVKDSRFSIGTDDEVYGGIWRPLFIRTGQ